MPNGRFGSAMSYLSDINDDGFGGKFGHFFLKLFTMDLWIFFRQNLHLDPPSELVQ